MSNRSLQFLSSFMRRPGQTGAVMPSSRYLARVLCGSLDVLDPGDLLVEYGPGTGPVTLEIARRLPEGVRFLGVELNDSFHQVLSARFPEMPFHHGSAADIAAILQDRGLPQPKRVISGLPFASLPKDVQAGVVDGLETVLAPGGEFRTFQYAHAYNLPSARRFRRMMSERFPDWHRMGPVLRNVPPAYVLVYRRWAPGDPVTAPSPAGPPTCACGNAGCSASGPGGGRRPSGPR